MTAASSPRTGGSAADVARRRESNEGRLKRALLLTVGVLLVEVAGGIVSGSLALLADAAHMFADVAALTLAWAGVALGGRAPTRRHTFGFARAEVLAAFVNAEVLLLASLGILWESWRRFQSPVAIHTGVMLPVAVVGLAANVAAARLLHGGRGSIGVRAAYLEVVTDALASVAVLVAAVVMARTRWYGVDAVLSAAIAVAILPRGIGILRDAAHILLEGAPEGIDLPRLRDALLGVPGVETIHDVHLWTLTSGLHSASVHIRAAPGSQRGEVLGGRAAPPPGRSRGGARHDPDRAGRRDGLPHRRRARVRGTMPQTPHLEQHFTASDTVRDVVIGMSDGLTVPFALAAGLSGAVTSTGIIVTAGLAEIAAGSIAMGLGGYLAARSDAEHYASEREREHREVREKPDGRGGGGRRDLPRIRALRRGGRSDPALLPEEAQRVDRLHDAVRARPREAGPAAGPPERPDDRRGLRGGRPDPARAVHDRGLGAARR